VNRIQRITAEEAKQFVPVEGDQLGYPAEYFTLTPSKDPPDSREWEDVTYYTGRRRFHTGGGPGRYWVYVLSNPTMPGLLKIGYTSTTPQERAQQISNATGVAAPFVVEYAFRCHEGEFLEREVHGYLDSYRVANNREFFKLELHEAVEAITELGKKYTAQNQDA
jgi:hypothetical protein